MNKLIIKNLYAHRRRYFWILLELVIVSIIAWLVLDPAVVGVASLSQSPGYDRDRLVRISLAKEPGGEFGSDNSDDISRIYSRFLADNRVETAAITNNMVFESSGLSLNGLTRGKDPDDLFQMCVDIADVKTFFATFGIVDVTTGSTPEAIPSSDRDIFVSKSVADFLFPGENPIGHYLEEHQSNFDADNPGRARRIIGVVSDAIYRAGYARTPLIYQYRPTEFTGTPSIVVRLKPGVSAEDYIRDITPTLSRSMRSGQLYPHSPTAYTAMAARNSGDIDKRVFITVAIAVFFFINVFLGITGTFYLQTRRRSEEAGVMRSFGATSAGIVRGMLAEGLILVTLACIVGFTIYRIFIIKDDGLAKATGWENSAALREVMPMWWDDFTTHFAVISVLIYVIMLIIVMLGIYIPARRISRVNPVEALREE